MAEFIEEFTVESQIDKIERQLFSNQRGIKWKSIFENINFKKNLFFNRLDHVWFIRGIFYNI